MGILALPIGDPELKEQELYVEPFLVYDCRENNVQSDIHVENLDFENLWLLKEGHCLRTQVYHICEQSSNSVRNNLNFVFESGSMDSLLRFAKSNKGMTIIPHLATMDFSKIEQASIKHFTGLVPSRSVGLITHQFFVKKKLVLELSKIIRDAVKGYIPYQDKTEIVKPL